MAAATGDEAQDSRDHPVGVIRKTGKVISRVETRALCPMSTPEQIVDALGLEEDKGKLVGAWPPRYGRVPSGSNGQVARKVSACPPGGAAAGTRR